MVKDKQFALLLSQRKVVRQIGRQFNLQPRDHVQIPSRELGPQFDAAVGKSLLVCEDLAEKVAAAALNPLIVFPPCKCPRKLPDIDHRRKTSDEVDTPIHNLFMLVNTTIQMRIFCHNCCLNMVSWLAFNDMSCNTSDILVTSQREESAIRMVDGMALLGVVVEVRDSESLIPWHNSISPPKVANDL